MKKILLAGLILIFFLGTGILLQQRRQGFPSVSAQKIKIVASFYPLGEFAKHIGNNLVEVEIITPAGAEPHDYEPTPREIAQAYQANLFLFNGAGLDSWAQRITPDLHTKGVSVIGMASTINTLNINNDPHFWLDPVIAQKEVEIIAQTIEKIDPSHTANYQKNSQDYIAKLRLLDQQYQTGLANCTLRDIIVSHDAFEYLTRRYHLNNFYISGPSPDQEPSPRKIGEIIQLARLKKIRYVFFETLVSAKIAQTIAQEIGSQVLVLNPIEGLTFEDSKAGKNYLSVMQENLNNLRIALSCK